MRRIAFFPLLLALSILLTALAGSKTFIKEYTDQASEDDSRNSSRVIALLYAAQGDSERVSKI